VLQRKYCSLRPIGRPDLGLIREWRNSDRVRSVMFTDQLITPEMHEAWFEKISKDPAAYYLLFEYEGEPVGMVYFTDYEPKSNQITWGFYKGNMNAPAGSALVMGFLGLEFIFEKKGVTLVHGETYAFNRPGLSYHQKLGFIQDKVVKGPALKSGASQDVCVFSLIKTNWQKNKPVLAETLFSSENPVSQ
jgi:UDP-4-amino-4,6-dideoxy-N-acetyl-beta-L-altrosamine N-acetyltransferase